MPKPVKRKRRIKRQDSAALRKTYLRARRAEVQFGRALRSLARNIGQYTQQLYDQKDPLGSSNKLRTLLREYGRVLRPWAQETAKRMVLDVSRRDMSFWEQQSRQMGRALTEELANAPTGMILQQRTQEAAALITSLPLEAAQRIEELTVRAMTDASRADEVAKMVMSSGQVAKSRAELIARTEVSRTSSLLVEARARHVGSDYFRWNTAGDIDVRKEHRILAGQVFRWDDPPIAGPKGERYLPGSGPNCRCWAEPIIPFYEG